MKYNLITLRLVDTYAAKAHVKLTTLPYALYFLKDSLVTE